VGINFKLSHIEFQRLTSTLNMKVIS